MLLLKVVNANLNLFLVSNHMALSQHLKNCVTLKASIMLIQMENGGERQQNRCLMCCVKSCVR